LFHLIIGKGSFLPAHYPAHGLIQLLQTEKGIIFFQPQTSHQAKINLFQILLLSIERFIRSLVVMKDELTQIMANVSFNEGPDLKPKKNLVCFTHETGLESE